MSVVVVGSVAFDSVKTPSGQANKVLGGAANYFSMAAHFFTPVKLVGVVGEDFPDQHVRYLESKSICTKGLTRAVGKTFFWEGEYGDDLNEAKTLTTDLNVFETFNPELPQEYRESDYVFLANIDPELQLRVLDQVHSPKVVVLDTMNFWIDGKLQALKKTISRVHILMINEGEAKSLSGESNLIRAGRVIRKMGPEIVVIKRGEYGALLDCRGKISVIPAFPLDEVKDPTGAGDTFAGGFLGYLVKSGDTLNERALKRAMMYGTVMASFNVQDFSFNRLTEISWNDIEKRYQDLLDIISVQS